MVSPAQPAAPCPPCSHLPVTVTVAARLHQPAQLAVHFPCEEVSATAHKLLERAWHKVGPGGAWRVADSTVRTSISTQVDMEAGRREGETAPQPSRLLHPRGGLRWGWAWRSQGAAFHSGHSGDISAQRLVGDMASWVSATVFRAVLAPFLPQRLRAPSVSPKASFQENMGIPSQQGRQPRPKGAWSFSCPAAQGIHFPLLGRVTPQEWVCESFLAGT